MEIKFKKIRFFKTIIFVSSIIFILAAWQYSKYIEIDACLDAGGRYNYELSKCECENPNYMPPMQQTPFNMVLSTILFSLFPSALFFVIASMISKYFGGLPNQRLKLTE
jgi:hypothetical protein